jgi:hypothetical protein
VKALRLTESEIEALVELLAEETGMTVIKQSGLTGYTYTLLNEDDTWFFLLNNQDYGATRH